MKNHLLLVPVTILWACPAYAAAPGTDLKSVVASLDAEYLSYSSGYGERRVVNARSRVDLGSTKLHLGLAQGERKTDDDRFKATRVSAAIVHDWTSRLSTTTSASLGSDKPVFVNRELRQDVNWKVLPQTVVTVGGRYARYYGGVDVRSWSAGASQYFRGGLVSYRFNSFKTERLGHSVGHLGSVKLSDKGGSTQVWVGHGSAIHDAEWLRTPQKGKLTSLELRRSQKLTRGLAVTAGLRRSWYDVAASDYRATGVHFGLTFGE